MRFLPVSLVFVLAQSLVACEGSEDSDDEMTARAEGPETDIVSLVYAPRLDELEGSFDPPSNVKSLRVQR